MQVRRIRIMAVLLTAVLLAACGGADTDELVEAGQDLADAAQEQAEAAQSAADGGAVDPSVGFSSERCQEIGDRFAEAQEAIGGDGDLPAVAEVFSDLADEVPADVSDDFQTYGDFLVELAEAQQSGDAAATAQVAAAFSTTELATAAANVAAFFAGGCEGPQ